MGKICTHQKNIYLGGQYYGVTHPTLDNTKMVQMKIEKNLTKKKPFATPTFCKLIFPQMPHIDLILIWLSCLLYHSFRCAPHTCSPGLR